jgi:hypothetical protein
MAELVVAIHRTRVRFPLTAPMSKIMAKKEAEVIERLITEGKLAEEDVQLLVREGLSQETVDYWKSHYRAPIVSTWNNIKRFFKF